MKIGTGFDTAQRSKSIKYRSLAGFCETIVVSKRLDRGNQGKDL